MESLFAPYNPAEGRQAYQSLVRLISRHPAMVIKGGNRMSGGAISYDLPLDLQSFTNVLSSRGRSNNIISADLYWWQMPGQPDRLVLEYQGSVPKEEPTDPEIQTSFRLELDQTGEGRVQNFYFNAQNQLIGVDTVGPETPVNPTSRPGWDWEPISSDDVELLTAIADSINSRQQ